MQRETHQMEICPQKSDVKSPNSASGMKKTCKTALEINTENANDTVLIAAISENRSRELALGIAMIDLSSPHELLLWNIIDSAHYVESISLLEALQPKEILVVETLQKQRVNGEIANRLANTMCKIIPLARKYFDQTKGGEDLKRVMTHCSDLNITRDYVLMAAVACLFRYIEFVQGVYLAERSIKVVVNAALNRLLMDYSTIKSLELLECTRGNSKKQSLLGILNNTKTTAGNRLLRSTILQPPCHLNTIISRQEVVTLFLEHPGWFFDVMDQLCNFTHLDRLLVCTEYWLVNTDILYRQRQGQLVFIPKAITPRVSRMAIINIIELKRILECLPALASCIEEKYRTLKSPPKLLQPILQSLQCPQFRSLQQEIARVISDRVVPTKSCAQKRIQVCFAVRAGIHGMLDVARRTYLDTIEKVYEHVQEYNETLKIPIRLAYTDLKGYHLTIPSSVQNAPSVLIKRVVKKKIIQCTTIELSSLNDRLQESMIAVYKLSNGVVQDLLKIIRPYASELYSMVECIGLLDMLLSFTNMIALSPIEKPYTRPVIFERGNLVIKQGRHPLVERSIRERNYVANDLYFDSMSTFHVISGSNCAGKTTYMKSVAIITILAHMGCYVPAVAAFLPLRDRICTRFGTSDDMEENASTFKVEMTETAFILEKATKASLVLVDELGRGTASDEGCALAWSISENLIAKGIYTCFATHFRQLNELANVYINCKCYHLAASFSETNVRYFHTLNDGACPEYPKYGIQAAKMCGLPMQIIRDAEEIYDRLQSNQHSIKTSTSVGVGRVESRLLHHLLALIHAGLDKKALRVQLQSLKEANQENSIE